MNNITFPPSIYLTIEYLKYTNPAEILISDGPFFVTEDDIEISFKKISIDTSPDSDGIVLHTILNVKCINAI